MMISSTVSLIATTDTIWSRLAVCSIAVVFGAAFIAVGIQNIKTETAEETGRRRLVNKALGASNTYTGSKAVFLGWLKVVSGVGCIIFGIIFLFVGPVLAK